jgi:DNA-binding PadR family transcriptional regulator
LKLSSRQQDFLIRLLDLYREARAPVHYADVARALDVSPVTAYEMLRLLEEKRLVRSETVRPQGHRGRSVVVFSPTEKAPALLAELTVDPLDEREWEKSKANILQALEEGQGTDYQDLLDELLLRIPERKSPLLFVADMVTAIILVFYELRDTAAARRIFPTLRWLVSAWPSRWSRRPIAALLRCSCPTPGNSASTWTTLPGGRRYAYLTLHTRYCGPLASEVW